MKKKILSIIFIIGILVFLFSCDLNYVSIYNETLNDEKVLFSLNDGEDFNYIDNRLEKFEIWDEQLNKKIKEKIFFYAYTYEEFIYNIEQIRNDKYGNDRYFPNKEVVESRIELYDESFFEENILLYYYKFERNISENYVYSVTKNDSVLTLNINRFEGMSTAISSWLEIVTIKKEDIKEIKRINLMVRTISPLISSVTGYIKEGYHRDFYTNPNILDDFNDLENIKNIRLTHNTLSVDLTFNVDVTKEEVSNVVDQLEKSIHVKSVGYQEVDFIRVQLNHHFYDEVINKTLVITAFLDEEFINEYQFTMRILYFMPIVVINFELENKGKEYALELIEELEKRNYPYLVIEKFFNIGV